MLIRHGVNPHQTWADFIEWIIASTLLRGNGLSEIVIDNAGAVRELRPVPWEYAGVQLLPNRRLAYDVSPVTTIYGSTGQSRRLLQAEVLHIRDRSDDGLIGRSRLHRAAETVSSALAVQEFAGAMYANQVVPSGVLEAEGKLSAESLKMLAERFREAFSGSGNAKKSLVLDQGLTWKSISISPEDAELLASRRFTTEELARLFQVPPPIVGDYTHNTFTNAATAGRWFASFTLQPWIKKIEAAIDRALLSEEFEIEIDLSGFLRGDPEQRWKAHEIAVKNRILTANEIRLSEGWNPRDGGDELPEAAESAGVRP
jgi:HK97 family phage portal protein